MAVRSGVLVSTRPALTTQCCLRGIRGAALRARGGWRVRLRVRRPVGAGRRSGQACLLRPFGSGALYGPIVTMCVVAVTCRPHGDVTKAPVWGGFCVSRRVRSIRAPRRSRPRARRSYRPWSIGTSFGTLRPPWRVPLVSCRDVATRSGPLAGTSCDGETRTRTGGHHDFQGVVGSPTSRRNACKSTRPVTIRLVAMPSLQCGSPRVWDSARG
jgi:hypothetical protein